ANESTQRYRATMLWYGTATPTAVPTDRVVSGSRASLDAHSYRATGDLPYPLTSGYGYTVTSPQVSGTVLATSGGATFRMALRAGNVGAFLRRTLDSCVPNQRANVFLDGRFAGTWYNAGVPRKARTGETDRCWRDDDFPLPRSLTTGRSSVEIRVENVTTADPPTAAWTASQYQMFSFEGGSPS